MLIDLRPISPPLVVIGSYEVAEQLVKASSRFPYSPPKAPETWNHLEHLTGPTSIAATQVRWSLYHQLTLAFEKLWVNGH